MPMPIVTGMPLSEFYRIRTQYEDKARRRKEERLNHGDDTTWQFQVVEEMAIDLLMQNKVLVEELNKVKALIGAE